MISEFKDKKIDRELQRLRKLEEQSRPVMDEELDREIIEHWKYRDVVEPSRFKVEVIKKRKLQL